MSPGRRFVGVLGAWALFFFASPGNCGRDGSLTLAILAIGLFGFVLSHPLPEGAGRKRALWLEYLAHVIGSVWVWIWLAHVHWLSLVYVGPAYALYFFVQGPVLRRLRRTLPFALALALCFTFFEALRSWLPTPFGLGWLRLGHHAHHHLWLSGSARVWGIEGLSWVVALAGGACAGLALRRKLVVSELALGLGGLAAAALLSLTTSAPKTRAGPRVLLIQPGFRQERFGLDERVGNITKLLRLTHEALETLRSRGEPPVDLVCWGESMLYHSIAAESFYEALDAGRALPGWWDARLTREWGENSERTLRRAILDQLYGQPGRVPALFDSGTWFLGGCERYFSDESGFGHSVALALFDPGGERASLAAKRFLCPGSETLFGLENIVFFRSFFRAQGGYVPDLTRAEETTVFQIETRTGESYRFSATLCFDNAFPDPYLAAGRQGPLDFHLVASNEAWFEDSFEMDQMVAFSRVIALATGRAFVRATTSGVSLVLRADGREIGRIGGSGPDREVSGWKVFEVGVPLERDEYPPYATLAWVLRGASVGIPLALFLFLMRRP